MKELPKLSRAQDIMMKNLSALTSGSGWSADPATAEAVTALTTALNNLYTARRALGYGLQNSSKIGA